MIKTPPRIPDNIINSVVTLLTPYIPWCSAEKLRDALAEPNTARHSVLGTEPFLTRQQVASWLQVSTRSVDRYIEKGLLRAYTANVKNIRIDPQSVRELLNNKTNLRGVFR